jgi:hypothetical protein
MTLALFAKAVAAGQRERLRCPPDAVSGCSELQSGGGGHHRRVPGVDGEPPDGLDVVEGDLVDAVAAADANSAGQAVEDSLGEPERCEDAQRLAG